MATLCRCPPDSVCVALCMNSFMLTSSRADSTAAATCSSGTLYLQRQYAHSQALRLLSAHVMGNRWVDSLAGQLAAKL
jgi:hypothetical protein